MTKRKQEFKTAVEEYTKVLIAAKPLVIGCVYGQTITETLFKQKIISYEGSFKGKDYYLVENIETGYRHMEAGCSLHNL